MAVMGPPYFYVCRFCGSRFSLNKDYPDSDGGMLAGGGAPGFMGNIGRLLHRVSSSGARCPKCGSRDTYRDPAVVK